MYAKTTQKQKASLSVPQLVLNWLALLTALYLTVPQLFRNGAFFTVAMACFALLLLTPVSVAVERLDAALRARY
jgi:hypothetical protein